jgi:hypothetical protein
LEIVKVKKKKKGAGEKRGSNGSAWQTGKYKQKV